MIYLPQRAVFIHIPRAAGNSVTGAIARSLCREGDRHNTRNWWRI